MIDETASLGVGTGPPVLRFAPSPNGFLHLGHALSALFGYRMARKLAGRFHLRIEDIDLGRCREEYVTAIQEDLAWLGISWDGPVRRQSEHFARYKQAACKLADMGLLYPCFASRREVAEIASRERLGHDPEGARLYPGIWRDAEARAVDDARNSGLDCAMRIDMAKAVQRADALLTGRPLTFREMRDDGEAAVQHVEAVPARWGDAVIQRKDVPTSYHLSVVVDDALQGITHVTRGRDLYAASDIHRLLQVLLGLPEPVYRHHRVILDATGRKLSKSDAATSLRSLREAGKTPAEVIGRLEDMLPPDLSSGE